MGKNYEFYLSLRVYKSQNIVDIVHNLKNIYFSSSLQKLTLT